MKSPCAEGVLCVGRASVIPGPDPRLEQTGAGARWSAPVAELATSAIERLPLLVERNARRDRALSDQLRRAAPSVVLNLAEPEARELDALYDRVLAMTYKLWLRA
jgi:hypothetical protein